MVMKKLFLISFLLISLYSLGQPGYTDINSGYRWLRGNFRALHVPSGTSFGLQTGQWPGAGALYLDTAGADSGFYYRGVNASWHRLPKATETFYYGDGTFSSNRTVTGGGFSLTFSGLSTFTLGTTGAQSFNANGGVGVRSDIYLRPDSILIEPHDGKITIDSLRSEHGSDTTTYKPLVWSPTNKSVRQLTYWPGGGGGGITGFSDGNGFDGTVTGSNLSLTTTVTDDQVMFSNSGAIAGSASFKYNGTSLVVKGTANVSLTPFASTANNNAYVIDADYSENFQPGIVWSTADFSVIPKMGIFGRLTSSGSQLFVYTSSNYGAAPTHVATFNYGQELIVGTDGTDNGAFNLQVNGPSYFSGQTQHEVQLKIKDISAPSTPASGYGVIYVNTDKPWFKDDGGNAFEYSLFAVSTTASSATPTPTGHARSNDFDVTALATNPTFAAPSGTPINGNRLVIRIKDDGTPRTLAFNAIYRAGAIALPTTTTTSKTLYLGFIYNSADSKWDLVSSVDQF
jgi:hypothetical protein